MRNHNKYLLLSLTIWISLGKNYMLAADRMELLRSNSALLEAIKQGNSELSQAAIDDDASRVKILLKKEADINATNKQGRTALMWAAGFGCTNAVRELLKGGAAIEAKDNVGRTALMNAAEAGQTGVVALLLDQGANREVTDQDGYTPLMYAAKDGQYEVAKVLIKKGVNLDVQNRSGMSALYVATLAGHEEVVRLLLEFKADVSVKSRAGMTALELAFLNKNPKMQALFKGQGATDLASEVMAQAERSMHSFRMEAANNPTMAVRRWGDAAFVQRWKQEVGPLFTGESEEFFLRDFFAGAVILLGRPTSSSEVIASIYSPWVDCLLMVKVRLGKGASSDGSLKDFRFIGGETWRQELGKTPEQALWLYSSRNPLVADLAKLFCDTLSVFDSSYVKVPHGVCVPAVLEKRVSAIGEELKYPGLRMFYRQTMRNLLLAPDNRHVVTDAQSFVQSLGTDDHSTIRTHVAAKQDQKMLESIIRLPLTLRKRLCPVYFAGGSREATLAFLNPERPAWVVVVRVRASEGQKSEVTAELMPLFASSGFMAADKGAL